MPVLMPVTCSAITKGGSRCSRPALAGKQHCLMHDPESAELRREAGRKGGHARSNAARAAKVLQPALTTDDLLVTLSNIIRKAEKREIEPGIVNCISGAARQRSASTPASANGWERVQISGACHVATRPVPKGN